MFAKILAVVGIGVACGLAYVLVSVPPVDAGAIGILAVFLLSYILSVVILTFFIFGAHRIIVRLLYSDRVGRVADDVTMRRAYYFSSILALGPIILVSLRSVGKVGIVELILVIVLLGIGCLYVSRQTS